MTAYSYGPQRGSRTYTSAIGAWMQPPSPGQVSPPPVSASPVVASPVVAAPALPAPVAVPVPMPPVPKPPTGGGGSYSPESTYYGDSMANSLVGAGATNVMAVQPPMGIGEAFKGLVFNQDGGFNLDGIGKLASGIGALGSLWQGFQQNRIAKDALNFQKDAYQTNLANTIKSYNTALEGRAEARFHMDGTPERAAKYIDRNKL